MGSCWEIKPQKSGSPFSALTKRRAILVVGYPVGIFELRRKGCIYLIRAVRNPQNSNFRSLFGWLL